MSIRRRIILVLALCAIGATLAPAKAGDAMVDKPVGKYFLFAGLNTRIDGIDTVAKADGNPILSNIGDWGAYPNSDTQGYLLVHVTDQNPSSSEDRGVGVGNCVYLFGYELQDGTQRDNLSADKVVMGKSTEAVQDGLQLHPKETKAFTFVLLGWNGSPVTKMFLKTPVECDGNPAFSVGAQYVRLQISAKDQTAIAVTPGSPQ